MRPIPATNLGHAHGLLRAIDKRGRLRTDEFVTEFSLEELFPPDLENALGRLRHFISYGARAGLVKEDRGVVELTDIGRRYIRAGDADAPFDISSQQAEWLRRQLREKHMTDSIFHGLAIGLSLLASCPPASRISTMDFGRSMAYLGRAGLGQREHAADPGRAAPDPAHGHGADRRRAPPHADRRATPRRPDAAGAHGPAGHRRPAQPGRRGRRSRRRRGGVGGARRGAGGEQAPAEPEERARRGQRLPRPSATPRSRRGAVAPADRPARDTPRSRPSPTPALRGDETIVTPSRRRSTPLARPPAHAVPQSRRRRDAGRAGRDPPAAGERRAAGRLRRRRAVARRTVASAAAAGPRRRVGAAAGRAAPPPVSPAPVESPRRWVGSAGRVRVGRAGLAAAESVAAPRGRPGRVAAARSPRRSSRAARSPPRRRSRPRRVAPSARRRRSSRHRRPWRPPPVESASPPSAPRAGRARRPPPAPPAPVARRAAARSSPPRRPAAEPRSAPPARRRRVAPRSRRDPSPRRPARRGPTSPLMQPLRLPTAAPSFVDARAIRAAAEAAGLRLPDGVYANVAAALDAGKHLLLTGAPGSGKTWLALAIARAAAQAGKARGATVVTGAPKPEVMVDAAARGRWVIVDELDQADPDEALAAAVELPRRRPGHARTARRPRPPTAGGSIAHVERRPAAGGDPAALRARRGPAARPATSCTRRRAGRERRPRPRSRGRIAAARTRRSAPACCSTPPVTPPRATRPRRPTTRRSHARFQRVHRTAAGPRRWTPPRCWRSAGHSETVATVRAFQDARAPARRAAPRRRRGRRDGGGRRRRRHRDHRGRRRRAHPGQRRGPGAAQAAAGHPHDARHGDHIDTDDAASSPRRWAPSTTSRARRSRWRGPSAA